MILVVNYKTLSFLENLVRDFFASLPETVNIRVHWVFIDAKDDIKRWRKGTDWEERFYEKFRKQDKITPYFYQVPNQGFASNVNAGFKLFVKNSGVRLDRDDFFLMINPDASCHWSSIEKALGFFGSNDEVAAAGLSLQDLNGKSEKWGYELKFPSLKSILFNPKRLSRPAAPSEPVETAWVSGGALMLKVGWWKKMKGFDKSFFFYFEDVDLCKRISEQNGKIYYLPDSTVSHRRGGSGITLFRRKEYYYASEARFFHLYRPQWEYLTLRIIRYPFRIYFFLRTFLSPYLWKKKILQAVKAIENERKEDYPAIRSFIRSLKRIPMLKGFFTASLLINIVLWAEAGWGYFKFIPPLVLHYNAYLGIDFYGSSNLLFVFPLLGVTVIIFNFILGLGLFKVRRYAKLIIIPMATTTAFQLALGAALLNILLINR